jgi:thiosulfate/3-mercaptopyruvate sulfurtransferase
LVDGGPAWAPDIGPPSTNSPKLLRLDVRDVDEWIGVSSSPYDKDYAPSKGRIPGSRWIERY